MPQNNHVLCADATVRLVHLRVSVRVCVCMQNRSSSGRATPFAQKEIKCKKGSEDSRNKRKGVRVLCERQRERESCCAEVELRIIRMHTYKQAEGVCYTCMCVCKSYTDSNNCIVVAVAKEL